MNAGMQRRFRAAIISFAIVLGLQATWFILPEIFGHSGAAFSNQSTDANDSTASGAAAGWAARLGFLRGELWAEYALTYNGLVWGRGQSSTQSYTPEEIEAARSVTKRALSHSPHDARIWALLAALDTRTKGSNHRAIAALKMSYYTGPNELKIIPLRLIVAVHADVFVDDEIQQLLRHEIRTIISRMAALKPAIVAAHREAIPAARQLIEDAVSQDPALLAAIRLDTPAR